MTFSLGFPQALVALGWKVKIYGRERLEPPHVTIIRGTTRWAWSLRDCRFLHVQPDPGMVPQVLLVYIEGSLDTLRAEWDQKYPENPVQGKDGDDE